jgi:hypothetical protein
MLTRDEHDTRSAEPLEDLGQAVGWGGVIERDKGLACTYERVESERGLDRSVDQYR